MVVVATDGSARRRGTPLTSVTNRLRRMTVGVRAVEEFGEQLAAFGWVTDLLVAGSLATGDHVPGVSDLDLVALTEGPVGPARQRELVALHRRFDDGPAAGLRLGCVYVDSARRTDPTLPHPTWTHGLFVQRILSGVTRAELVRHGYAVSGRAPGEVLPPMSDDDVREAARAELTGYWAWAARRPWLWLGPGLADLGLTSMARGRYALQHGDLLTKSAAVERIDAPAWLVTQVRARRRGQAVASPRLRTALVAWRDARRTVRRALSTPPPA
jgi:Nucleotidyltransferase domain